MARGFVHPGHAAPVIASMHTDFAVPPALP